jgi:hypothetical protein
VNNEELHNFYLFTKYYSDTQIREVTRIGEMRNAFKVLVGKFDWHRLLWRPWRRLEKNIGSICYIRYEDVD